MGGGCEDCAGILEGDGGRELGLVARDANDVVLDVVAEGANALGAANFVRILETLLLLGFFWWPAAAGRVVFCLEEISSAAICFVTAPMEVIVDGDDIAVC